jgi:hypothetical protein
LITASGGRGRTKAVSLPPGFYGEEQVMSVDTKEIDASLFEEVKAKKADAEKRAKAAQTDVKFFDDLLAELKKSATDIQG